MYIRNPHRYANYSAQLYVRVSSARRARVLENFGLKAFDRPEADLTPLIIHVSQDAKVSRISEENQFFWCSVYAYVQ